MLAVFPRRIRYLFALIGLLFIMQGLFRALHWVFVSDLPVALEGHLWQAFAVGLRFDLRVAMLITLCTLPWLMIPRFNALRLPWLMTGLGRWVAILLLALLCVYALDAGHYLYLSKRLDVSIVRFHTDIEDSATMVWQSYPVVWITLAIGVLWWASYQVYQRAIAPLLSAPANPQRWWQRLLILILVAAVLLLIALGRWSLVPLRWNHAYFHGDAQVAALALNPLVWIYDTAKFTNRQVTAEELTSHLPMLEKLLDGPFEPSGHALLDRWRTPVAPVVGDKEQPNIVIVFLESLGNTHIGAYGNPLQPTPNIDKLITQSRWYPNFNVPARSTAKSVFTSITGIPDVSAIKTATRNPYITHQRSLFSHFTDYDKFYMLGGSAGWANMSATVHNSISGVTLYEEKYWQSPVEDVWGITDRDLITESSQILQQAQQPFVAYIQTAANHSPHTIPDGVPGFTPKQATAEELKAGVFIDESQYNAVRLIDHNVGYLLDRFKQLGLYEDSIFVFFADHQALGNQADFLPEFIFQYGIGELPVPLIIHNPKYVTPEVDLTYGNLSDLLPTIAGLFPAPYLNTSLGRDLAWAKGKNLPTYGFVQDERKSVVFNKDYIASINHESGDTRTSSIDEQGKAIPLAQESQSAQDMLAIAEAYYIAAQYLLRANVKLH